MEFVCVASMNWKPVALIEGLILWVLDQVPCSCTPAAHCSSDRLKAEVKIHCAIV